MAQVPSPNTTAPAPPSTGTILSILVAQGSLSSAQASSLPQTADNATIELYLRLNHLANEDQILQAYAALYQLPYVRLKNRRIKPEVLRTIPEMTARRYDIVAYDRLENGPLLVALATPRKFRPNQQMGLLRRLQSELQVKIAPALAPLDDIRAAFAGYENKTPTIGAGSLSDAAEAESGAENTAEPTEESAASPYQSISLIGRTIPLEILQRFPEPVARTYGLVAFAEPEPNSFQIAALDPAGKATQQVLEYLKQKNQVNLTLYQTDQASLEAAWAQYQPGTAPAPDTSQLPGEQGVAPPESAAIPTVATSAVADQKKAAPTSSVAEVTADELIFTGSEPTVLGKSGAPRPATPTKTTGENALDSFLGIELKTVQDLVQLVKSGNIPKMVAGTIALAISLRASDIHIEAEKGRIRLRYRIDGELEEVLMMPRVLLAPLVSRVKILSQMKIDENRVPQDGRFGVTVKGRDIDLRVSTLPTVNGEKVVIRILDKATGILTLEEMGIDGVNHERLIANVEKPYGIVLSTGPTGSGKSTTLYAILQRISQTDVNVITLEDPVEYEMVGINQTQIKPKIGFTFAEGLRSILRQDPNIIMVGEIRDKETAEMATHAALTGHLVLSTLHTNTAAGALPRLINMGIEPFLITSSINAVVGQRLVRRVCQKCKQPETLPQGVVEDLQKQLANSNVEAQYKESQNWHFVRGKGCPDCHNGYRGRIGIFEVLAMSESIEALAVKKEPTNVLEQQALKEGMITMKQDGIVKALQGLTTVEEVMKATTE